MPTMTHHQIPEYLTWDQQAAAEAELQARGQPPSLPPDIRSTVVAPERVEREGYYTHQPYGQQSYQQQPQQESYAQQQQQQRQSYTYNESAAEEAAADQAAAEAELRRQSLEGRPVPVAEEVTTTTTTTREPALGEAVTTSRTVLEEPLEPLAYDVGLFDDHTLCRPTETLLVFKGPAFLAGRECEVKDSEGHVVITVRGHTVSFHGTKDVYAADGTLLFVLKNKIISLRRRYEGTSVDGVHLFEITHGEDGRLECSFSPGALVDEVQSQSRATYPASIIKLRGDFHGGNGDLVYIHQRPDGLEEEVVVAQVRHSFLNGHSLVKDDNTYYVKVAARVDLALIGTICLSFSQLR